MVYVHVCLMFSFERPYFTSYSTIRLLLGEKLRSPEATGCDDIISQAEMYLVPYLYPNENETHEIKYELIEFFWYAFYVESWQALPYSSFADSKIYVAAYERILTSSIYIWAATAAATFFFLFFFL